jgi:hypothetical protein
MVDGLMRGLLLASLLALAAAADGAAAQEAAGALNTDAFIAACVADPVVIDEPGFAQGGKATPQAYCQCVADKFKVQNLRQSDVDMMTKMHKDEITDEDAATYTTLEELMATNENIEDDCKESLGMPSSDDDDEVGPPPDEEDIPQDE